MKLIELAAGYEEAAEKLTKRIDDLRNEINCGAHPVDQLKWELDNLRRVRTDLRKTGELCRRYYERGFWRDADYTFNTPSRRVRGRPPAMAPGTRGNKSGKLRKGTGKAVKSDPGRTDAETAEALADVLLRRAHNAGDRRKGKCKPVNRIPDPGPRA